MIAGARVAAIETGTSLRYAIVTGPSGEYHLANLPPGVYRIEVEKPGFKKMVKPGVTLHVQDALSIDFELALGRHPRLSRCKQARRWLIRNPGW